MKVLDFGVAKMMSDNTQLKAAMAKTGMNITSFTPQYGAPEQFSRSYGATGPWTDVYALALVAVEMLTGKPALDGDDIVQLAFATGNPNAARRRARSACRSRTPSRRCLRRRWPSTRTSATRERVNFGARSSKPTADSLHANRLSHRRSSAVNSAASPRT